MRTQRFLREAGPPVSQQEGCSRNRDPHPSQFGLQIPVRDGPDALLCSLGLPFFALAAPQHSHLHEGSHWGEGVSPGLLRPFPVTSQRSRARPEALPTAGGRRGQAHSDRGEKDQVRGQRPPVAPCLTSAWWAFCVTR